MVAPGMRVKFYGVRGSVPAPGPATARYGGNTSCVELELADGTTTILDAGTGLRELGNRLTLEPNRPLHLLLSHVHWDHIQGLPFFAPVWRKDATLVIHPLANQTQERFRRQLTIFDEIHFPVRFRDIPSTIDFVNHDDEVWQVGSAKITRINLNHPGGSQGFRIEDDTGHSVAYLTDNEISAPSVVSDLDALAKFAEGVDLLIHDSQYLADEMPAKRGWGHSVVDEVLELGKKAQPKHLALFHHDPVRSDDELDEIGENAKKWFDDQAPDIGVTVAREGLEFDLE